jgi:hypothetical protein
MSAHTVIPAFPDSQLMINYCDKWAVLKLLSVNFLLVCINAYHNTDIVVHMLAVLFSVCRWAHFYQKASHCKALDMCDSQESSLNRSDKNN